MEAFGSSIATFPMLKTLILRGYPPLDPSQSPAWKILRSMPRLHRLEILYRLRVKGANAHRYILMANDASPAPGEVFLFPSQLEMLTIANPSLNDHVFQRLPLSLKYLFLDFVPDWENMLSSKDSLAYHRPAVMKAFLSMMYKCHDPSGVTNIEELHIKMGWCATPSILNCISLLFPNLKFLELQGLRYVDRGTEPASNLESCALGLARLRGLRTLMLAMELQEDPYEYTIVGGPRNVGSINQSAQVWADTLALQLPTLQSLALETRPHTGRGLGPRMIIGRPSWTWFSRRKIDPSPNVMNRVDVSDGGPTG
ncbi:hypothetical protein BDZ94DRAFT_1260187 [Collybia nuda]|uniref:Uncharacterized protein n=1 Tax=Collybia nuda TaxID=64659 RepID=A0A9P6CJJ6_9AGAR|nr:hypothetical protein BDZ94DRAFT_1260187 [Collybia nuda]